MDGSMLPAITYEATVKILLVVVAGIVIFVARRIAIMFAKGKLTPLKDQIRMSFSGASKAMKYVRENIKKRKEAKKHAKRTGKDQ